MNRKWTRRSVGRLILGAPVAAAAALGGARGILAAQEGAKGTGDSGPSPLAKLLAKEDGLSGEERAKVRKNVTQLEGALQAIRDFKMSNDVPPAGTFRALRSKRG
jgi:hypothetical protein